MKAIKNKISSVKNTKQITKALEIVSTVKLKKQKDQTTHYKEFTNTFLQTIQQIHDKIDLFNTQDHNNKPQNNKTLLLIVSTEKGLCGGLNARLFKKIKNKFQPQQTDVICIGKKAKEMAKRAGYTIINTVHLKDNISSRDCKTLYTDVNDAIQAQTYTHIDIAYNYFHNTIQQVPSIVPLFPLDQTSFQNFFETINIEPNTNTETTNKEIALEPTPTELKQQLQKMLIEHIIYGSILQNKTGEFAARMLAMKNAHDNATSMIKSLKRSFNKARQAAITQEVAEITSAKISMET